MLSLTSSLACATACSRIWHNSFQILTLGDLRCFRSQPIAVRSQPIALNSPGCKRTTSSRMLIFSLNLVFEILRCKKSAITDRRCPPIARSPIAPSQPIARSEETKILTTFWTLAQTNTVQSRSRRASDLGLDLELKLDLKA